MPRRWIILSLAVWLLSVETRPFPMGQFKTTEIRNNVRREVDAVDLNTYSALPTPLPAKEALGVSSFEKQRLKSDQPQLLPPLTHSDVVTDSAGSTETTEPPTQGQLTKNEALSDLRTFERALRDLQEKLIDSATNSSADSNREHAQKNLTYLTSDGTTRQRSSALKSGANTEFASETQKSGKGSETPEHEANSTSPNAPAGLIRIKIQIVPRSNGSTVQTPLSRGNSTLPPFSSQYNTNISTEMKEPANQAEKLEQAPPIHGPSEQLKPSADDNIRKESDESINELPQRLPEHENKPLLGMTEETALSKVMEEAQNMPLEYDSTHTFLEPEHQRTFVQKHLENQDTEPGPVETNVLRPISLPASNDGNKK